MISIRNIVCWLFALIFCALFLSFTANAQSTDQNYPTAVTNNEIDGIIKARDIGDSRLTSYFYTFDGGQGDVFVNVVTKNFSGDIDVFAVEGLRPLAKMVIYSDGGVNETGRLIYMRKTERLVLRIEGRSPNDDPATFRIKFAGSFVALSGQRSQDAPAIKGAEVNAESGIRVNSVGTIVEVLPKPQPSVKPTPDAKETTAALEKKKRSEPIKKPLPSPVATLNKENKEKGSVAKAVEKKPVKEPVKVEKKDPTIASQPSKKTNSPEVKTVFGKNSKEKVTPPAEKPPVKPAKPTAPPVKSPRDPMANFRLVVQLRDGKIIERPMSEITTFKVDNGVLTVVAKDGKTIRYSMLDVAKVTIE